MVLVAGIPELEAVRDGPRRDATGGGAQALPVCVAKRAIQVRTLAAGDQPGLAQDSLERVLDEILGTVGRARQQSRDTQQIRGVAGQPLGIEEASGHPGPLELL
jgi:hypothetical protein